MTSYKHAVESRKKKEHKNKRRKPKIRISSKLAQIKRRAVIFFEAICSG